MLSIKRPAPSTVLYSVSTRSQIKTLSGQAARYGLVLVRIVAGILALSVLLNEYYLATSKSPAVFHTIPLISQALKVLTAHTPRPSRLILMAMILWLILRRSDTTESLLVIRGLGIQTSTSSSTYLWTNSTRFIPTSSVQDIFIHESFKGFEVKFYLAVVVVGEEDLVVVFPVRVDKVFMSRNGWLT